MCARSQSVFRFMVITKTRNNSSCFSPETWPILALLDYNLWKIHILISYRCCESSCANYKASFGRACTKWPATHNNRFWLNWMADNGAGCIKFKLYISTVKLDLPMKFKPSFKNTGTSWRRFFHCMSTFRDDNQKWMTWQMTLVPLMKIKLAEATKTEPTMTIFFFLDLKWNEWIRYNQ